jgi:hypothetical protein
MKLDISTANSLKKVFIFVIFISFYCSAYSQNENLTIPWPADWKLGSNQETPKQKMLEFVPLKESVEKWTIIGTMITFRDITNVDIESAKEMVYSQAKKNAIDPVLTVIEKNDTSKNPWILFKIEAASYKNDPNPESQLFYVIQGNENLYNNIVAVKKKTLADDFISKWSKILKSGKLTTRSEN